MKTIAAYVVGCVSVVIWVAMHIAEFIRAARLSDTALGRSVMALCVMALVLGPASVVYVIVQALKS